MDKATLQKIQLWAAVISAVLFVYLNKDKLIS